MLYVFHVDTGTMMTFDMNLAMEKVSSLKSVIARGCRISEDKQVLLISGGESLDPTAVVGKYHAGTDTNPIFLFSKSTIESSVPPSPSVNYGSDIDLQGQVEGSLLMPPAYETVVSRAQLALQFQEVDSDELRACERLIHDQHLQQQGWAAVVANLEDVTVDLQQRSESFHDAYVLYLEQRETYRALIASVSQSLQLLAKIPVLPCLARSPLVEMSSACSSSDDGGRSTLFDWISAQDTNHSLQDMVEQCNKATEQLDQNVGLALKTEVDQMFKEVHNDSMKEVKGLEDRLYGLDQIISGARKVVQEQADLAQGFVLNQNRLSNLRDRSVLPALCSSHRNQLVEMLKNHTRLRDIKKKCRLAKEELSVNLHTRLRWVMYVEKKICDVDGKLTIYLGNLKRLRKRLDILQQVHDAPTVYAQLVIEVVRRRSFSRKFLRWATNLAEGCKSMHTDEVKRREAFTTEIGHHFLQSMFQGLEDHPSAFATEAPSSFDHNLPDITVVDIQILKEAVPELSGVLSVPAEEDIIADLTKCTDSSVHWVEHPDQNQLSVPHTVPSGSCSDTDIVFSEQPQPFSIEGGSISLGDQLCEAEEEIIQRPGFDSLSPPDKEFLLPKSLSEELTKEMTIDERRQKQKSGDKKAERHDAGSSKTEAEKTKESSSSSSASVPLRDVLVRTRKSSAAANRSVADLSPDIETSQGSSTGDFYIDESMPSSIESPPKTSTCTDSKANLEQLLVEEKHTKQKLEQELSECKLKLTVKECKLKSLKELVDEKLPQLREFVKDIKDQHFDDVDKFVKEFEDVKENLTKVLKSHDVNVSAIHQNVIDRLMQEKQNNEKQMSEHITAEAAKCQALEGKLAFISETLAEKEKLHSEEIEKLRNERTEIGAKLANEVKDLTLKHELELEVEVDKAKDELLSKLSELEKELEKRNSVLSDKESTIKNLEREKIKLEESLLEKFQKEKDNICSILGIEYEEKLDKALQEEKEKISEEKQKLSDELKEVYEKETQKKLDELKQSMLVEKEQALEMTQSTLTTEHGKASEELKQNIVKEKAQEMEELKEELLKKYNFDLAKLSAEFNKEKEKLVTELKSYTERQISDGEIQTVMSIFNSAHCDTQTEPDPVKLATEVQTEISDQSNTSMQTDGSGQTPLSTQTDPLQSSTSYVQTEKLQCSQISMQTDTTQSSTSAMQTDHCEIKTPVDQSHLGVQTEYHGDQSSTQTDSVIQNQLATQTDTRQQDQSSTQTDPVFHCQQAAEAEGQEEDQSKEPAISQADMQQSDALSSFQTRHEQEMQELEEKHNAEISRLIEMLEKEKEDSQHLRSSLTSATGEQQTRFNEAVNKVCQGKDRVIEELRNAEKELQAQITKQKEVLAQIQTEKTKAEEVKDRALNLLKDKEREFSATQRHMESELGLAQQQVKQYKETLQKMGSEEGAQATAQSAPTPSPSVVKISDAEDPELQQRIKELEDEVRLKEEELNKMQSKVMELSMSASTRSLVQDKVSITSCHVGDLVLLCLDERLEQYVVFTVGNTLHFLHTDCLEPLGIKSAPGEVRKQWLIAEVTDKEYCQAKKPNNRFRVPVGTKFYRVKAKKWSREVSHHTTSSSASASS